MSPKKSGLSGLTEAHTTDHHPAATRPVWGYFPGASRCRGCPSPAGPSPVSWGSRPAPAVRAGAAALGTEGAPRCPLCAFYTTAAPRAGPRTQRCRCRLTLRPGRGTAAPARPRCGGSHGPAPPLQPHQSLTAARVSSASHPGKPYPGRRGRLFPLLGSAGCAAGFQLPRCRAAGREEPRRCRHCPCCNE